MMMIFVRFYEKKEIKARRISSGRHFYLFLTAGPNQGNLIKSPIMDNFKAFHPFCA